MKYCPNLSLSYLKVILSIIIITFFEIEANVLYAASSSPPLKTKTDVLIVGAGLSGLSIAYRLQKAGLTYKIFEATSHIGGRVRTAHYPEHIFAEAGLEEFWETNPTLEIIRELKVSTEKSATAYSSFLYQGKIVPFIQNTNREFLLSYVSEKEFKDFEKWDKKIKSEFKSIENPSQNKKLLELQNISFAEWIKRESRLSKKVQDFIRVQTEPEYGTSWSNISALEGLAEWKIFSGEGINSFHVIGGNQRLMQILAEKVGLENILLNMRVSHIQSSDKEVTIQAVNTGTYEVNSFTGNYVVTTQPLFRLREIQFKPPLTPIQNQAIQTQTWGSYFTAHIILDSSASHHWMIQGENILPILTDGPLGVIYGGNASIKNPKQVVLNLLVTGGFAESFNARTGSSDLIRTEITQNLENLWPGISSSIQHLEFYNYHPRAIASWPVGRSRFDQLSNEMRKPFGRIYFAGDFTQGTHSDGAAESAIRVVRDILKLTKNK